MIILAILVYAGLVHGAHIAWWMFILAALFDLEALDTVFGQ